MIPRGGGPSLGFEGEFVADERERVKGVKEFISN